MVEAGGTLLAGNRQVGTGDVAHKHAVARQYQPGLVGARVVDHLQCGVLRAVPGSVDRDEFDVADADAGPIGHRAGLKSDFGERRHPDWQAELEGQDAVARDVVGVRMRLDHTNEARIMVGKRSLERANIKRRVDHDRLVDLLTADEVAGAAKVVMDQLLEDHLSQSLPSTCSTRTHRIRLGPTASAC